MCCFSFHPVKPITTGEGGAVTTNDASLAKALQRFRTHGITRDPDALLADEGPWYYEQQELGFNYRLTDIQAALGTSQLGRLGEFVAARRQVAAWYGELLPQVEGARLLKRPHWSQGAHHLLIVRVPRVVRRQVFEQLRGAGIGVNVHYIPVYRQPYYRANGFEHLRLPNAETYYGGAITLPIYPGLSRNDVQRVVQTLSDALMGCAV
jgi:dTDP-4-amino-4,6-dideoxygalactose transaminase